MKMRYEGNLDGKIERCFRDVFGVWKFSTMFICICRYKGEGKRAGYTEIQCS